jgi:ATP-dependent Clp protease ATP-binding subunit ClpX
MKPNKAILAEVNLTVHGHSQAKKALITLLRRSALRHYQKWYENLPEDDLLEPLKCLLIGGSGTGKTFLMQELARICDFPLVILDASKLNPTGAGEGGIKIKDIERKIHETASDWAYAKFGQNYHAKSAVDRVVVFLDEFDKISKHYDGSSSGKWNMDIQTTLLTLIDDKVGAFNGISWVLAGAFSGLEKTIDKKEKAGIGFNLAPVKTEKVDVLDEDVINYGLIPEIVGRLSMIVELDKLSENDYYKIMINQILPKRQKNMKYMKLSSSLPKVAVLKAIAKKAVDSSQGVRYLHREINKLFIDLEFDYETCQI